MTRQLKTFINSYGVTIEYVEEIKPTSEGFVFSLLSVWRITADELRALRKEAEYRNKV